MAKGQIPSAKAPVAKQQAINTAFSNEIGISPIYDEQRKNKRGIQVYTVSQLFNVSGRGKHGELLNWGTETPFFYLTIQQRNQIFKLSAPVFGIVSGRMQRISSLPFNVVPKKKREDEDAETLKTYKQLYTEYDDPNSIGHATVRAMAYREAIQELPDLKPDFSNFPTALYRWKRRIQQTRNHSAQEIKDWLIEPNNGLSWEDWVKKSVYNQMIHGCDAVYKHVQGDKLENFDSLPGGSVYRVKDTYFSTVEAYIQIAAGFEPQIFFSNELAYVDYLPTSTQAYSFIPLEALINKVAEELLFDKLSADQADGTKPPDKMIIITDSNPFGGFESTDPGALNEGVPIDRDEQARIEEKINEPRKNAMMTFTGNNVEVVDLSRDQMFEYYSTRQKDIREAVGLVYGASNIEMNLTGADATSGRSTSEAQLEVAQGKAIAPIAKNIENLVTRELIPYRYGPGWQLEFDLGRDERAEVELDLLKLQTGELTKNELRESKNKLTFSDEQYDLPDGADSGQPTGEAINPFNIRNVE